MEVTVGKLMNELSDLIELDVVSKDTKLRVKKSEVDSPQLFLTYDEVENTLWINQ